MPVVVVMFQDLEKDFEKTEDDIKAVQSVGQIIGEVMKQLDDERCEFSTKLTLLLLLMALLKSLSRLPQVPDMLYHSDLPYQSRN